MNERYDEHYVRSVVNLGDTHHVFSNQAIFTNRNIKLIEKGVKVDSSLFDRLVSHKLIPKIDQCLSVEGGVTQQTLRDYAESLLDNDPGMAVLRSDSRIRNRLLNAFNGITLLEPLAFKLTVASTQRPEVFDHSLRVALIALYLARKSLFFSEKELSSLATAAVFHDLGVLHISPNLMRPGRRLQQFERHHLYAHPITAYLILRRFPEYHPEISRTVFEHHERLDGSGYPRGLKSEAICLGAQILMLAEVVNTVFERDVESKSHAKLSIMLKLNQTKFNDALCKHLIAILNEMEIGKDIVDIEASVFTTTSTLESRLTEIAKVFQDWAETSSVFLNEASLQESGSLLMIVDDRIADLRRSLLYTGFDVTQPTALVQIIQGDFEAMSEFGILINETRWQLAEIVNEAHRRLNDKADVDQGEKALISDWLANSERTLNLY